MVKIGFSKISETIPFWVDWKKKPQPTLRFSVTVSKPTDLSKVSAEILYRKPGGGKLIKIDAQKR